MKLDEYLILHKYICGKCGKFGGVCNLPYQRLGAVQRGHARKRTCEIRANCILQIRRC